MLEVDEMFCTKYYVPKWTAAVEVEVTETTDFKVYLSNLAPKYLFLKLIVSDCKSHLLIFGEQHWSPT